ncbi:hypothetical protein HZH68_007281 [Vespula germanica]|uniref:Uncharacterized protein n=1 Tax=Vespula germanica TaxID=30212 RepID=A0A834KCQ1_VESGE|nr:hypothetical protein HZH68_007281 [Vespula germanica]
MAVNALTFPSLYPVSKKNTMKSIEIEGKERRVGRERLCDLFENSILTRALRRPADDDDDDDDEDEDEDDDGNEEDEKEDFKLFVVRLILRAKLRFSRVEWMGIVV